MMKIIALFILGVSIVGTCILVAKNARAQDQSLPDMNAHHFTFVGIDGTPMMLEDFKGRAVLVVNVASQCGFTDQYAGLQALYETYKDRGLAVLGVPSNDFGGQEPGSEDDIKAFASEKYNVTFPMTQKYAVSGKTAHPFYAWAADQGKGGLLFSKPRWNFHKYLIAPDGSLAASFGSQVGPQSDKLIDAIEANLPVQMLQSTMPEPK